MIKNKLEKVYALDQTYRQEIQSLINSGQLTQEEYKEKYASKIEKIDNQNIRVVCEILDKYGYIGKELIGYKASYAQFLVIQHAPHDIKIKYNSVMEEAFESGKISKADYATFVDRLLVEEGKKQLYGTQYRFNEEKGLYELEPTEDIDNIEEVRKEMGLSPIESQNNIINKK